MSSVAVGSQRQPRVLACVLCQHRKIKCDRNTPCSNCIKAKVTCTPSTPAPTRKRRRPNQDLQERLARCEELLKQYASGPGPAPATLSSASSSLVPRPAKRVATSAASAPTTPIAPAPAPSVASGLPASAPSDAATPMSANNDSPQCRKAGTMIVSEDGTVRFMDSYVFATVYDELQKMRDIVETDDHEDSSVLSGEDLTPENNADLFLYGDSCRTIDLAELQPDPLHIFRLWQIFLDRINPLTKLIHAPTMQPMMLEAATNMSVMPLNSQALLFSIFAAAVVAMSQTECLQTLGVSRMTALQRFDAGTKTALVRYNFIKNHNMVALQALVLYFFTLEGRYDRNAAWVLSGTIMRIAQKMGYHRDGEQLKLGPYETEMRRRIWWHIIIQDSKAAMLTGLHHSGLVGDWDTKPPSNLNDADLMPDSTLAVKERDGPTEMAFCMILYELFRLKLSFDRDDGCTAFEAAVSGQEPDDETGQPGDSSVLDKFRQRTEEIETRLGEVERKYVDVTAGNVHIAALSLRPMLTQRAKEMFGPLHEQPEWGTEIFGPKDKFFKVLLMGLEHKMSCHERMAAAGFDWFMRFHMQLDLLAAFTAFLHERPMGSLSDRAWDCMAKIYSRHSDLGDMTVKAHVGQAQLTLRAWRAREAAFAQMGQPMSSVPAFIGQLREMVPPIPDSRAASSQPTQPPTLPPPQPQPQQPHPHSQPHSASNSHSHSHPHPHPQPQPMVGFDQLFGDYLSSSTINWETFGELMLNGSGQLSAAAVLDGYGLGEKKYVPGM